MTKEGLCSEGWDKLSSRKADFLIKEVVRKFEQRVAEGRYGCISFELPCQTWSRARRRTRSGPGPLRGDNANDLFGLLDLSEADAKKVLEGNMLTSITLDMIEFCIQHGDGNKD